jgi:hypothetical protein
VAVFSEPLGSIRDDKFLDCVSKEDTTPWSQSMRRGLLMTFSNSVKLLKSFSAGCSTVFKSENTRNSLLTLITCHILTL